MKPFNLQAALAGAPVVNRKGEPVTGFKARRGADGFDEWSNPVDVYGYKAMGADGIERTYTADGAWYVPPEGEEKRAYYGQKYDLFMAEGDEKDAEIDRLKYRIEELERLLESPSTIFLGGR